MLQQAYIEAIVPVSNLEAAIAFYGEALGLELIVGPEDLPENREALFDAGGGSLVVYESAAAGKSGATLAAFVVDDLDARVAELRERGVVFEEYDYPNLKTENGIATLPGHRDAWCRDPDGNILAVAEPAAELAALMRERRRDASRPRPGKPLGEKRTA